MPKKMGKNTIFQKFIHLKNADLPKKLVRNPNFAQKFGQEI